MRNGAGAAVGATAAAAEDRAMMAGEEDKEFAVTAMAISDTMGLRGNNQEWRFNAGVATGTGPEARVGVAAGLIARNRA
jgi:hypothetical protein